MKPTAPSRRPATVWSLLGLSALMSGACGTGLIEDSSGRRGAKDTPGGSTGSGGSGTGAPQTRSN
jgi:hypothetical protein